MPFRKKQIVTEEEPSDDGISMASSMNESMGSGLKLNSSMMVSIDEITLTSESEGIEIEAVEFVPRRRRKKKVMEEPIKKKGCVLAISRRMILLMVAVLVILAVSAITGVFVFRSQNSTSLASQSALQSDGAEMVDVTKEDNDENKTIAVDLEVSSEGIIDLVGAENTNTTVKEVETGTEIETQTEAEPTETIPPPTSSPTEDSTDQSSGSTPIDVEEEMEASDSSWDDHELSVSSSCVEGLASAVSVASFKFASKRDGDWYWIRGVTNTTTAQYDSWDYTEETDGELPLLNLANGGKYIISLVRDSMQPYNEIITHEFTIPECPVVRT